MALPPNKDELEAVKAELIANGVQDIEAALTIAVVEGFEGGEWTLETAAGYPYKLKAKHPELWSKQPTAADTATAALEREAFTSTGAAAATARAKLVKAVGEDQANIAARTYGLKSIGDFASKGVGPACADEKGGDKSMSGISACETDFTA
jgi:hypothetical protein